GKRLAASLRHPPVDHELEGVFVRGRLHGHPKRVWHDNTPPGQSDVGPPPPLPVGSRRRSAGGRGTHPAGSGTPPRRPVHPVPRSPSHPPDRRRPPALPEAQTEERRVGKECRARRSPDQIKKNVRCKRTN